MTIHFTPIIFAKFMKSVFHFKLDELNRAMADNEFILNSIAELYGEDEDVPIMQECLGEIFAKSYNIYNYLKEQHMLKKLLLFAALYINKHKECVVKYRMAHALATSITLANMSSSSSSRSPEQTELNEMSYRRYILLKQMFDYIVELSKKIVDGHDIDLVKDVVIYYEKDELNPGKYDIDKLFDPLEPPKLIRSNARTYIRVSRDQAYLVKDDEIIKNDIHPIYDENDEINEYNIPMKEYNILMK